MIVFWLCLHEKRFSCASKESKEYFGQSIMNEIFQKIDPHDFMKNVEYELSFNDKNEPQLCIHVREDKDEHPIPIVLNGISAQRN